MALIPYTPHAWKNTFCDDVYWIKIVRVLSYFIFVYRVNYAY
jgi:hypothetical protein